MNKHVSETDIRPIPVMVSLDQLIHGSEYPGGSVNSRIAYREQDIEQLAHSLLPQHDGQLKPLLCCTHPSRPNSFYVFDGGRRMTAFGFAVKSKLLDSGRPIEIRDFGELTPAVALQLSWAANEQVPLHPADRYAVFAQMHQDGASAADIAKERGMTVRAVEQSLAFGAKLAPESLDAWRGGEITKDIAQILTLGSHEDQAELLVETRKKHKRWGKTWATDAIGIEHELRKALAGNEEAARKLLKFVGEDAYIADGGRLAKDLFRDNEKDAGEIVQDFNKLKKLARVKLQVKGNALLAEGWAWVDIQLTPHFSEWSYGKSKDKKKAGCVVRIAGTKIEVKSGLVKKQRAGDGGTPSASEKASEPPAMDHEAEWAIDAAREKGAGAALKASPLLSLAALGATIASCRGKYGAGLLAIELSEARENEKLPGIAKTWHGAFAQFAKMDIKGITAHIAAAIPDLVYLSNGADAAEAAALIGAIDQKIYAAALLKCFDAKVFFGGCSKKHLLTIIADVLGDSEKRKAEGFDQKLLAKMCLDSVAPKGWLPPELRTKLYAAPQKATVKATGKSTAKKGSKS